MTEHSMAKNDSMQFGFAREFTIQLKVFAEHLLPPSLRLTHAEVHTPSPCDVVSRRQVLNGTWHAPQPSPQVIQG